LIVVRDVAMDIEGSEMNGPPSALIPGLRAVFRCVLLVFVLVPNARADLADCGDPFVNHFGPFDYRTASTENKRLVENTHFKSDTEQLKPNSGTGYPAQDIGYTLSVFPNHPRALLAMSRLAIREKAAKAERARFSVNCYFDRAIRFTPDDADVYMIYGAHLMKTGALNDAVAQLRKAVELNDASANAHYNLGLAYVELKDYDSALVHAQRAYALGFPLPGLRNVLQKAGKWQPQEGATKASQSGPASTAPGRAGVAN
jgi:hypothetical protein